MTWTTTGVLCRALALGAVLLLSPAARAAEAVLVFAAASLTDALNAAGAAYEKTGAAAPAFSFAASSTLARQIENGAPAHLFISADEEWMDYLAERKLIVADTRTSFLGNTLVLIAPAAKPVALEIGPGFPLAQALRGGRLALADPDAVPAGRYGKAALEHLNVWNSVEKNVVRADNVRAALVFVAQGEAAAGIVYGTDAAADKRVTVAGVFPETSHPPISYPLAVTAAHDTPAARAFRDFLLSDAAKAIYTRYGFAVKQAP